jgi:galactitol-specific phosphotransferase system IIC component
MNTIGIAVGLITFSVMAIFISFKGLDLRIWSSWLMGVVCFLSGFLIGFYSTNNLIEGLKVGCIFALVMLICGAAMRRHKQRYSGMAGPLLLKYGKEDDLSLFAKLVRRFLGKYK